MKQTTKNQAEEAIQNLKKLEEIIIQTFVTINKRIDQLIIRTILLEEKIKKIEANKNGNNKNKRI